MNTFDKKTPYRNVSSSYQAGHDRTVRAIRAMQAHNADVRETYARTGRLWLDMLAGLPQPSLSNPYGTLAQAASQTLDAAQSIHEAWHECCGPICEPICESKNVEIDFDKWAESAGPADLHGLDPAYWDDYVATDLVHGTAPVHIPASHVVVRQKPESDDTVLVTLADLGKIIEFLPLGAYTGELRLNGFTVATITATYG